MPVKMKIVDVVVHSKFENVNAHDIALAKLEAPVEFTDTIKPIKLPARNQNFSTSILYVAGFGDTKNASQSMLYLRYVKMKQITNRECSMEWMWTIKNSQMCSLGLNNFNHTTCRGDSGSGLIEKHEDSATVLGIVSYGAIGCLGKPKVFTRVSSYLDFIHDVTNIEID
jgi:secreted trypsin-like serine protease